MTRPTALVTGASAGIGAEFARLLAPDHDLVLVARDAARLEALAKELADAHGTASEVLAADLGDDTQLASVEARIADASRPVDIVVNNAGFGTVGEFAELPVEREDAMVRLNVLALTRLSHAAARTMTARGTGGILNVASLGAFAPVPRMAVYGATKAFISSFTQALHEELLGTGVRVSCLCPGFTRTEFQARAGVTGGGPAMLWASARDVAQAGLAGLAGNKALVVPGALNATGATLTKLTPAVLARKISGQIMRRAEGGSI
ncbi:MAG TPA: SDR family oxidoreductase [Acidimicrobiia bacterium]|nr:SDR family oxidoreductase [Acidimicrobiia bacterium]